jgi:4-hydroxy-tetrahydrodipicolinate synthase
MKRLHGTGVALVTPFLKDGSVDYKSLRKVLQHTSKGVDYFVVMGTTGESVTLNRQEKLDVLSFVRANNPKALPIVYGIGGNNTQHVLEEIKYTDLSGVDALLSVSPYYNRPSQEGIYQHFSLVADASPLPLILYNVPGRTASNITAETTLRLAANRKIIGVKEASGNLEQCMKISMGRPKGFLLISGDDLMTVPLYAIGADGVISVLANAFPVEFHKMYDACEDGDFRKASEYAFSLISINGLMYEEGSPVGVKYLMSLMEICKSHVRLPHAEPSEPLRKKIESAFRATRPRRK